MPSGQPTIRGIITVLVAIRGRVLVSFSGLARSRALNKVNGVLLGRVVISGRVRANNDHGIDGRKGLRQSGLIAGGAFRQSQVVRYLSALDGSVLT